LSTPKKSRAKKRVVPRPGPPQVAQLNITPSSQTNVNGVFTQRGPRVHLALGGQSDLDLATCWFACIPMLHSDAVADAASINDTYFRSPKDFLFNGEAVMVSVILRDGASLTEDELREYCAGKIAHYKVPRYVTFVDAFPMTVTGKVQKFKMREVAIKELGPGKFELVAPSVSILAEPPVAVVDKVAGQHGTKAVAQAYLEYLYTPEGQEIAAQHFYRPRLAAVAAKYESQFPKVSLVTVDEVFGGWKKAHAAHFADGALFDQIYQPGR